MADRKKRAKNFTTNDKLLLLGCVKSYIHIIECHETNKKSNVDKDIAWCSIEKEFNSQSEIQRDAFSLKSSYIALKMNAKKKNAAYKRSRMATGGGSEPMELDLVTKKMLALIENQVSPLNNEFDSGASYHQSISLNESEIPVVEELDPAASNIVLDVIDVTTSNDDALQKSASEQALSNDGDSSVDSINELDSSESRTPKEVNVTKMPTPTSKFPTSKKRKADSNDFFAAKKARLIEKSSTEETLAEMKFENFKKQGKLLDLQIETAEFDKESARLKVEIKKRKLNSLLEE